VKKTVAAHTDYIYTQDLNLSPWNKNYYSLSFI
jgi:hypothetical protein